MTLKLTDDFENLKFVQDMSSNVDCNKMSYIGGWI